MTTAESYHSIYCHEAGQAFNVPFRISYDYQWGLFASRFTQDDLRLVIRHIKRQAGKGRNVRSLKLRTFLLGPMALEDFEQDLAEARAVKRQHNGDAGRASILRATSRPGEPEPPFKSLDQIMAESALLKKLRQIEGI